MRLAYLDSVTGVSGDMFVGALLDAGASLRAVCASVDALGLKDVEIRVEKVSSHGLAATAFSVLDRRSGRPVEEAPAAAHRRPHDMAELIGSAGLEEEVASHALAVIRLLAEAEAKVHGVTVEEVHFHEVGAVDTIVDAVAAAAAFVSLSIDRATASPARVGGGTVKTMHGFLPVPAPATLELLKGAAVSHGGFDRELTTPTGAALLVHYAGGFGPFPEMTVVRAGYGAGRMDLGSPNVFRVVLGES